MMRRALAPLLVAVLGLAGSLTVTLFLHRAATTALERATDERLRGAGRSAALLLADGPLTSERLLGLMRANALDGAFVVSPSLSLVADATGPGGGPVDLLRVDPSRVEQALAGEENVAAGYRLGELTVATGYFPVRGADGHVSSVLALEAGQAFTGAGRGLPRALVLGMALSLLSALAIAVVVARWLAAERRQGEDAEKAARGEMLTRMSAVAAHEIRNPLGVIRATVELMRDRLAGKLSSRDLEDLDDVLSEVERLKQLTQDFLDLSADRSLALTEVELEEILREASHATEVSFPGVEVKLSHGELPRLQVDPGRLRQVLANLLTNAAQAQGQGALEVEARREGKAVRILVKDRGPGVPPEMREKLFEPFVTGKANGTGLGLAVSRQIIQRHGGTLELLPSDAGATFEIRLPVSP